MTDAPMDHTTGASLRGVTVTTRILCGDSREMLSTLPDGSVQTCVTSPPYFGLRDYGHAGQIGLEATVDEYVTALVDVFREVRRVLADDGTLWLNLGDSYAGGKMGRDDADTIREIDASSGRRPNAISYGDNSRGRVAQRKPTDGLKPKDLIGIPWRVAFALQQDGWYLRSDIIWHKPNPMPESVTDRPTKSHEYLFLLSKAPRYYYDAAAIAEPHSSKEQFEKQWGGKVPHWTERPNNGDGDRKGGGIYAMGFGANGRNKRSVWTVATQAFSEAHFATFPPKLIEPCILAGSRPGDTVLDPFGGAGTTGLVADRLGRDSILIELNPDYAEIARRRITNDAPMFASVEIA